MSEFRKIDLEEDLKEAVDLINEGLDAYYTEEFFRWKHIDNPFGKSYGLLAIEKEKIIALRMFMFWEFIHNDTKFKAIRPVDTVVNKAHRGKGLFKKLTLKGLEDCKANYNLIFNTPNSQSLGGYLKMGWSKYNSSSVYKIGIINPLYKSLYFNIITLDEIIISDWNNESSTNYSTEYFKWRYGNEIYKVAYFNIPGHYLIFKKIRIKGFSILIICEISGKRDLINLMLNSLGKKYFIPFIYFYCENLPEDIFFRIIKKEQPVIVLKNDSMNIGSLLRFSLGDMEGKL